MPDTDLEALRAVAEAAGAGRAQTSDVAERLGCSEEEAERRLRHLVQSGRIAGSWVSEPWGDVEWELLGRGREELDA